MNFRTFFPLLVLSLVPGQIFAQGSDIAVRFRAIVEEERARSSTPGISAALLVDGNVIEAVSGIADREVGKPVTPDTVFGAASVSKLFTATLVMQQVEAGKLSLDEPVNRWLDPSRQIRDANGIPVAVTLRNLLTHTSGLPVDWSGPDDATPPTAELLAAGSRVIRPANTKIVYANRGFVLLGYLAEQSAGEEFSVHVVRALLKPLGMRSSSFHRADLAGRVAAGYGFMFFGNGRADPPIKYAVNPAGSLFTTPGDLLRFARMILQEGELDGVRILSRSTVGEMLRLQATNKPLDNEGWGLGFMVRERNGRKMVWHDGDYPGVASRLALLPYHGAAVAILSNRQDHDPVNRIARRALDLVAGEEPLRNSSPENYSRLAGVYRVWDAMPPDMWPLDLLMNLEVRADDRSLTASFPFVGQTMNLHPLGNNRFRVIGGPADDATLVFDKNRLVLGFLEAHRVPVALGARALAAYGAGFAILFAAAAAFFVLRRKGNPSVHWERIISGGILLELGNVSVAVPILLFLSERASNVAVVFSSFLFSFVLGFIVARRAGSRYLLHGALIGATATSLFLLLSKGAAQPVVYLVAHGLKIAGGTAGGHAASKQMHVVGRGKTPENFRERLL